MAVSERQVIGFVGIWTVVSGLLLGYIFFGPSNMWDEPPDPSKAASSICESQIQALSSNSGNSVIEIPRDCFRDRKPVLKELENAKPGDKVNTSGEWKIVKN